MGAISSQLKEAVREISFSLDLLFVPLYCLRKVCNGRVVW
jgi:hypothetical protein